MESYRFVVHGKVQGVFYRKFVAQKLRGMGVRGAVRNLPDGTVEVLARITEEEIEPILEALEEGSPLSEVDRIEVEAIESDDLIYDGFEIRY
jgi:acylphosphatase